MEQNNKPFFLYLGHSEYKEWYECLDVEGKTAEAELNAVCEFLGAHKNRISGIIFKWSDENVSAIKHTVL